MADFSDHATVWCAAPIAQLVELKIHNSKAMGSSPTMGVVRQVAPVHPAVNGVE